MHIAMASFAEPLAVAKFRQTAIAAAVSIMVGAKVTVATAVVYMAIVVAMAVKKMTEAEAVASSVAKAKVATMVVLKVAELLVVMLEANIDSMAVAATNIAAIRLAVEAQETITATVIARAMATTVIQEPRVVTFEQQVVV